ncbi:hypothetical protein [Dyadobacter sp. 32]|uniref:hypothetical protein n=1 Tax=Dyadobacter sp. 32 TaxID=538966 RepID=UPI0011EC470E
MYQALLIFHSATRWLVLLSLAYSVFRAYKGYSGGHTFTKQDDTVRHVTATVAHIQLMIGFTLYFQSPIIKYFWQHFREAVRIGDSAFFGLIHMFFMFIAIMLISIGSALAKRQTAHHLKFRIMLLWFSVALIVILALIPWPFSPLAGRPFVRFF